MSPPAQPPSSPAEIGFYWSDEQIFLFLDGYTPGLCLPNNVNVLAGSSPYLYRPSNLPEEIWYLVHSNEKKESVFGSWKPKGEACKIYSNSVINGWRSTLEYYEGKAPHAQRTDWVMQEYSITQKELKNNPEEFTSLCRVFHSSGSNHINQTHMKDCENTVESKDTSSGALVIPKNNNTSKQDSKSESKSNSSPHDIGFFQYFLSGDFLELNDLEDPESHSSSSQNSSCPSKLSDEYFDSLALLHELEEGDVAVTQGEYLSSGYSITTSVKSNDVIMVPPLSGSVFTGAASTSKNEPIAVEHTLHHSAKRDTSETSTEGNSNSCDASIGAILGGKKENDAGRKKMRHRHYFCLAFF